MRRLLVAGASTIAAQLAATAGTNMNNEHIEMSADDDPVIKREGAHNLTDTTGAGVKRAATRAELRRQTNQQIPDNIIPTRQILRFAKRKGTLKQRLAKGN